VSSDHQAKENTVASQVEALRQRIEQDGMTCRDEQAFIDEGYSGSTLVRPALERLRDQAAAGRLDRLYVMSPDRLARKYAYQVLLVDELQAGGVELVFLNRAFGESPEDALLLQVQGVVAEYERAKIMERCRRGKLHAARGGRVSVMSSAPYGYRYVRRVDGGGEAGYIVHLEEAKVVRQIFEWMARDRISLHEIARRLQKQGILSPRGRARWERNTVWKILQNPTYQGTAAFGKTRCGERRPRLRPLRHKPEQSRRPYSMYNVPSEKWISIPVPAILSEGLFAEAREQLADNRKRYRGPGRHTKYLLRGLIVCRCCGYAMCGITVSPKTARRRLSYYRCIGNESRRFEGGGVCRNQAVNATLLEEAVWEDVRQFLSEPERIEAEYQRRLSHNPDATGAREGRRRAASLKGIDRGIERLIDAYGEGLLDKSQFEPRIKEMRDRKERLAAELQSQINEEELRAEMRLVIGHLQDFADQVKVGLSQADGETKRKILRALVKRVEVEREEVRVVYRADPRPAVIDADEADAQDCSRRQSAFSH